MNLQLKFKILLITILMQLMHQVQGQDYVFSHYGLKEGLSQSVVNCIFQDSEGYMWFGTQNGLNRFDGYNFKKFISNPYDSSSIPDNRIFSITEDNIGNLWIGTIKGLVRYNKTSNKFSEFEYRSEVQYLGSNAVNGLNKDSKGNILINSKGLLTILNPITLKLAHYQPYLPFDGAIYDQNRPIIIDLHGNIWFGTQAGLCKFTPKTKQFVYFNIGTNPSVPGNDISALFQDSNGNIWIGTNNGLAMLDPITQKSFVFNQLENGINLSYQIRAILQDKDKNLWIATENGGVFKMQISEKKISLKSFVNQADNPNGLTHNIVYDLYIDRSNNLWVGTLNGIDKTDLKQKKFNLYRKTTDPGTINLADNVMAALFKENDGQIWIGTWGSGLNIYDRTKGEMQFYASKFKDKRHIPNDFVHVIFKDSQRRIWIGTRNGLCIYDKNANKFSDYRKYFPKSQFPGFENNRIYCMLESQDNKIVIGTANGLHILNTQKGTTQSFFAEDSTISGNLIYSVMEDAEKEIWIATTNGLDRYNPIKGNFIHYRNDPQNINSIIDNFVVSLCLASDGKIWVGTNSGICRLDKKTEKFEYFPDFPSNIIYDILEDNQQNIWLSSGLGLSLFDSKTQTFINYDTEDGLQSLEFNLKACFKADDGEIFFGGMNGFNSFYPDSLQKNRFIPEIVITSIEKENQTGKHLLNVPENNEIVLTHNDYVLSIDYASLDYTHPEKNKYAYEMIGLSDKRVEYGNRRHVTFLNLPPGDYEFRVYGTNSDVVWNETPAILKIAVLPPWWKSRYAYATYIVLLIFLFFFYIKFRERRLKYEKRILEEKVQERTREILTQKDEILAQRDEIEVQRNYVVEQRDQIASKNREIKDSILYAKRIQTAVLPPKSQFKEYFSDFFVFYKPKDIVSGDFYWIKKMPDKFYFAVADCTGHGVPGAFVSMLGISFLNEIIQTGKVDSTGDYLDKLRLKIKDALQQTGKRDEAKDGMDISLVMIDLLNMKLEFSGANSHGLLYQNGKSNMLIADKMPIGIHGKEQSFNTQRFNIAKGNIIYLYSDGYMDQFGGKTRRKFMSKNFKELLEEIHPLSMHAQWERLNQVFHQWKADCDQVDDITVLGVRI